MRKGYSQVTGASDKKPVCKDDSSYGRRSTFVRGRMVTKSPKRDYERRGSVQTPLGRLLPPRERLPAVRQDQPVTRLIGWRGLSPNDTSAERATAGGS